MPGPPRVGVTLPTFTADGTAPILAALQAEHGGIDGVFVFDHLWPMGSPGRPALWSFAVLGAVVASTSTLTVGPLVARIGLLPAEDLIGAFSSLAGVGGPGRIIAALGAGDGLSAAENRAYGIAYPSASERLSDVAEALDQLRRLGLETWVGARSPASVAVATAHADVLNTWGSSAEEVARLSSIAGRVTWGGQVLVGRDDEDLAQLTARYGERRGVPTTTVELMAAYVRELGAAGAEWCVLAPLDYLADPVRSLETVCLVAEAVR